MPFRVQQPGGQRPVRLFPGQQVLVGDVLFEARREIPPPEIRQLVNDGAQDLWSEGALYRMGQAGDQLPCDHGQPVCSAMHVPTPTVRAGTLDNWYWCCPVCCRQYTPFEGRPIPDALPPEDPLEAAYRALLADAEGDRNGLGPRDGLAKTPARAASAWRELMSGYGEPPELTTFEASLGARDQIVLPGRLPFHSVCEHHLLPFMGTADFAYLPGQRLLGLSKFARLLDHYSHRLQTQENIGAQLADHLQDALAPRGLMIVLRAEHLCMSMRGVQASGHMTVSSVVRGAFKDKPAARAEALSLLKMDHR